jgi:hypothetical protein
MAEPNASNVIETPAATTAPAKAARHSTNVSGRAVNDVRRGSVVSRLISMQPQEREDGHDHNYEAYEIDDAVHHVLHSNR